MGLPEKLTPLLLAMPPIPPTQTNYVIKQLKEKMGHHIAIPLPETFEAVVQQSIAPQPHLYIYSEIFDMDAQNPYRFNYAPQRVVLMQPSFYYGTIQIQPDDQRFYLTQVNEKILLQYNRDRAKEQQYLQMLLQGNTFNSLAELDYEAHSRDYHKNAKQVFLITWEDDIEGMVHFNQTIVPQLKKSGWQIQYAENMSPPLIEIEAWYTDLQEKSDYDWFGLELGIMVEGERINLLPYLIEALQQGELKQTPHNQIILKLPNKGLFPIPADRFQHILTIMMQLLDPNRTSKQPEILLSRYQATLLVEMEKAFQSSELRWFGSHKLRDLGKALTQFEKIKPALVPQAFSATLRSYQQEGVNWLQFLTEFRLSGILADDMGLGKTVQTLAHLSIEKYQQRLTKPCLIIAPTSVIPNWHREIQRFCPFFKTMVLQGSDRKAKFSDIAQQDIVLTTYPLLIHDKEILIAHTYHLLVLDEAHFVKNARAKMTQIAQQLKAEHRLCLTGTPLENHLGELWSLFHFLMPGLLGSIRQFKTRYQTPIEKHQDRASQQRLLKLISPFILRRTKQEVVSELPEKTEIIQPIELHKQQRDLYESIRLALHKKINKVIDQKGIERSQIIILDALLKLRQVCCDPRLVAIDAAKKIQESAKLEILLEMVDKMREEGRRLLIFSQFTSMLALIEQALNARQFQYVKLTGQTADRITPIQDFQEGQVNIFLISLKAGGTGLNLTAADTVIHYDPWWNPAVERQATDRAHRIGQTKAMFVYKLIAVNTVEEKMLEMQKKKSSLMDIILKGDYHKGNLTKDDFEQLFAQ